VTGATGGIGFEFCKQFASKGVNVILISRNLETLNKSASDLKDLYPEIKTHVVQADFSADQSSSLEFY
jgi:17beta-estradiol 17-dehydrogenase / very-long-chain 3-oxoacyl-CoA reductase